jgi:methylated-DNA-protein-cysteine methyltransferase related protein
MKQYTLQVIEIIKSIPDGYVMTYGQIAELAGNPRGARQVVRILHSLSGKYELPWHRVVNAKGEIAVNDEEARHMQRFYLEQEGAVFDENGRVELERCRYIPGFKINTRA